MATHHRYKPNVHDMARAALAKGKLIRERKVYRFGRRTFGNNVIADLVTAGHAYKLANGDVVKATP